MSVFLEPAERLRSLMEKAAQVVGPRMRRDGRAERVERAADLVDAGHATGATYHWVAEVPMKIPTVPAAMEKAPCAAMALMVPSACG